MGVSYYVKLCTYHVLYPQYPVSILCRRLHTRYGIPHIRLHSLDTVPYKVYYCGVYNMLHCILYTTYYIPHAALYYTALYMLHCYDHHVIHCMQNTMVWCCFYCKFHNTCCIFHSLCCVLYCTCVMVCKILHNIQYAMQ